MTFLHEPQLGRDPDVDEHAEDVLDLNEPGRDHEGRGLRELVEVRLAELQAIALERDAILNVKDSGSLPLLTFFRRSSIGSPLRLLRPIAIEGLPRHFSSMLVPPTV